MRIRDMSPSNRPRERLLELGPSTLSESELLAIVLRSGRKNENILELSNRLLASFSLENLRTATARELISVPGIGEAKACQIAAVFELAGRRSEQPRRELPVIGSARDVYGVVSSRLRSARKEHFLVLHLDTKNRLVKEEVVSIGTLNCSIIHPREVFQSAIREGASAVILVHNHPSGDPEPSPEDNAITERIMAAGRMLSISVLDHVIIGDGCCYSFIEKKVVRVK